VTVTVIVINDLVTQIGEGMRIGARTGATIEIVQEATGIAKMMTGVVGTFEGTEMIGLGKGKLVSGAHV
jgi:hypothetical protein